jgi:hypothetical protein
MNVLIYLDKRVTKQEQIQNHIKKTKAAVK